MPKTHAQYPLSSGTAWSSWCERAARPESWVRRLSRPPRPSGAGSSRPTSTGAVAGRPDERGARRALPPPVRGEGSAPGPGAPEKSRRLGCLADRLEPAGVFEAVKSHQAMHLLVTMRGVLGVSPAGTMRGACVRCRRGRSRTPISPVGSERSTSAPAGPTGRPECAPN